MRSLKLLLIIFLLAACSKEDPKWEALELNEIITRTPGGATEVKMSEENTPIAQCVGYGKRCIPGSGRIYQLGLVKFIAVQFMSEEDAWFTARELGQFYSRNWLFDDVTREPSVESFLRKRVGARAPGKDENEPPVIEN